MATSTATKRERSSLLCCELNTNFASFLNGPLPYPQYRVIPTKPETISPRTRATPSATSAILEPRFVGDIEGNFYVPSYQRGYRWTPVEVRRLLDDIGENRNQPYYLQPVVVKARGDEWELIDGQHRLTTLFLIFQYMQAENLQSEGAHYRMRYETRPAGADFLAVPEADQANENVDFFHIYNAYETIDEWFTKHGNRRQFAANKFYSALFQSASTPWIVKSRLSLLACDR